MLPAILPVIIAIFAGGALYTSNKKIVGMTPERVALYQWLLNSKVSSEKLASFADKFRKEGLIPQANLLAKRARLRAMPPEMKAQRRAIFKKALSSKNPAAIENMANILEKEGATGAARRLREYAMGVREEIRVTMTTASNQPVPVPPPLQIPIPEHETAPTEMPHTVPETPAAKAEHVDDVDALVNALHQANVATSINPVKADSE